MKTGLLNSLINFGRTMRNEIEKEVTDMSLDKIKPVEEDAATLQDTEDFPHEEPGIEDMPEQEDESTRQAPQESAEQPPEEESVRKSATEAIPAVMEMLETLVEMVSELESSFVSLKDDISEELGEQNELIAEISDNKKLVDHLVEGKVVEPILKDLILHYDTIVRSKKSIPVNLGKSKENPFCSLLKGLETETLDILARHGVTLMTDTTSSYDAAKQKIVQVEAIKPKDDGEVVKVCRRGFYRGKAVLRPEEVCIQRTTKKEVQQ